MSAAEVEEKLYDRRARGPVKVAGGFIRQHDVGSGCCGPGKGDTLLFATRQLRRVMLAAVRQADRVKLLGGAFERVGVPGQFQRSGDVLKCRHRWNQVEGLKHHAEMITPQPRQLILVHIGKIMAKRHDLPGTGPFKPAHQHQKRRFAGTRGANKAERFAFLDIQRYPVEYPHKPRIALKRKRGVFE